MKPVCYADLDGVLADFVRSSFKLHGVNFPYENVRWEFPKQIGFEGREHEFWNPLGREFWANLEPHEDGMELLKSIESLFGDHVALMTSPCKTDGCVDGKLDWVAKHLPDYRGRVFVGPSKHLAAGPKKNPD